MTDPDTSTDNVKLKKRERRNKHCTNTSFIFLVLIQLRQQIGDNVSSLSGGGIVVSMAAF